MSIPMSSLWLMQNSVRRFSQSISVPSKWFRSLGRGFGFSNARFDEPEGTIPKTTTNLTIPWLPASCIAASRSASTAEAGPMRAWARRYSAFTSWRCSTKGHNEIGTVSVKVWSLNYGSKSEYFQETSNDPCEVFRRIHRHLKRPYNCVRGAFSGFTLERTSSQAFFISSNLPRAQMREGDLLNPLSVGKSWLSGRLLDMINSLCITSPVGVLLENEGTISTSPY